jgi:DNA-binding response OmpR family regulator
LPDHKLLIYSVSPNFNTIGLHKSVTTSTDTRFSNSITTNNEHILLVDDEEDIAQLFKKALERAGFIVDKYNDPLQSLSNYGAGMYDLLLLDIKMPEMNGFELYKKIRQIDDKTKVCFMTAFEEYYDEFRKTFPDLKDKECFIRKPIGMNDLIKSVKSHLN